MRHAPIPSQLFTSNRQRLQALLPPGSLAIVTANDILPRNADGSHMMVVNSDLFYLTGIEQEETVLVFAPDAHDEKMRTMLFLRKNEAETATVEGQKLSEAQATALSGITEVRWLSELPVFLHKLTCELEQVYLNSNEHYRAVIETETREIRFARELMHRYPLHRYCRLAPLMQQLRLIKSEQEISLISQACGITRTGFLRVMQDLRPGMNECEVEAIYAHEFTRNRGFFAYNPIIASGLSACTLHYNRNDQECKDGDLLLLDVAASYANYNSDLTRTIPVNGRFTPRQRQVYDAVLRIQRAMIKNTIAGKLWRDWQMEAEDLAAQELCGLGLLKKDELKRDAKGKSPCKKYFMHGVGHPIGLDVHDIGRLQKPFAVGWVMTVEPGIYIPEENFAVRLEDVVTITATGQTNLMADIPVEADDIERLMARSR